MTTAELIGAIVWSVVGLTIGYGLGRYHARIVAERGPHRSIDRTADRPRPADGPGAARDPGPARKARRVDTLRTIAGVVILLLVAYSVVSGYRTTACQAGYNAAVTRSISSRSDQQSEQLEKQIEQLDGQLVLLSPLPPGTSDAARRDVGEKRTADYRAAVQANRDSLVKLRDARAANKIPAADSCGDQKR